MLGGCVSQAAFYHVCEGIEEGRMNGRKQLMMCFDRCAADARRLEPRKWAFMRAFSFEDRSACLGDSEVLKCL